MDPLNIRRSSYTEHPNNKMSKIQNCENSTKNLQSRCLAVQVTNAKKSYFNGVPVLNDFNMNVTQGSIYGLLGSSGCGKTTMLSCIVGINKLDSGDVFVFGQRPGAPGSGIPGRRIGYMPQEISLYPQLSIRELLQYFGQLNGMTDSEIDARIESLTHFLDLPSRSSLIGSLSGGQARRTSLAASLLHEPPLLILDEPTVGVDPLLRESIWNHLTELVTKRQTTIIITTHYIEEARNSHTVGLMRGGRLLVEKAPGALLEEYNVTLLEDIVLSLCKKDEATGGFISGDRISEELARSSFYTRKTLLPSQYGEASPDDGVKGLRFKQVSFTDDSFTFSPTPQPCEAKHSLENSNCETTGFNNKLRRIRAVTIRNILILIRNPLLIFVILGIPIMDLGITNYSMGPMPKNLKFGIVNPEISNNFSYCSNLLAEDGDRCALDKISCRFMSGLPKETMILEPKNSVSEALAAVQKGDLWGYLEFPEGYSNHTVEKMVHGIYADTEAVVGSTVNIRLDMSTYFAGVLVQKTIYDSFQAHARSMLKDCDQDPRKADLPLNFRKPIYGSYDGTFRQYILAAVMIITIFFISGLFCIASITDDRAQGTMARSALSGLTYMEIMMAYVIVTGFLVLLQTMICYTLTVYVFQIHIHGSSIVYLLLIFVTGIGGISFGFMMTEIFYDMLTLILAATSLFITSLSSCGVIWPLDSTPYLWRMVIASLPFTRSIDAVRSIESRDWTITHPQIYPAFLFHFLWIFISWLVSVAARRYKKT